MTDAALRLAPSGPSIKNISGAVLKFGKGARLRLTEAVTTNAAGAVIPTVSAGIGNPIGAGALALTLPNPDPFLNYRAQVHCDVLNASTNVQGTVELFCETSPDAATWTEVASNSHVVAPGTARLIALDVPLLAGATLGVAAGAANLVVRFRIGSANGAGNMQLSSPVSPDGDTKSVGAIDMTLEECF